MKAQEAKNLANAVRESARRHTGRSAWDRGVFEYVDELLTNYVERVDYAEERGLEIPELHRVILLNGSDNWEQYSYGGFSLIYDEDIAKRLCTPSELKKSKNGDLCPNRYETWLDVQARALFHACRMITAEASLLIAKEF